MSKNNTKVPCNKQPTIEPQVVEPQAVLPAKPHRTTVKIIKHAKKYIEHHENNTNNILVDIEHNESVRIGTFGLNFDCDYVYDIPKTTLKLTEVFLPAVRSLAESYPKHRFCIKTEWLSEDAKFYNDIPPNVLVENAKIDFRFFKATRYVCYNSGFSLNKPDYAPKDIIIYIMGIEGFVMHLEIDEIPEISQNRPRDKQQARMADRIKEKRNHMYLLANAIKLYEKSNFILKNLCDESPPSTFETNFYTPDIEYYFGVYSNLREILVLGLAAASALWPDFLRRGLYDPRLFVLIFAFC